jgi:ribosomal protein S12 methylthiotransferase
MTLQRKIAREKNKALVGRELEVLVEGASEEHDLVMMGRHRGQAPEIDGQVYLSGGDVLPGEMRKVRITQASDYDLVGDIIDADDRRERGDTSPKKKRVSLTVLGSSPRAHQ